MLNAPAPRPESALAPRIWVVENDDALRAALAFTFKTRGFSVSGYPAAHDAELSNEPCDCLIIDFLLPDANGLELLQALRGAGNTAPAILVVTKPGLCVLKRAEEMRVSIIQKPLLEDDLFCEVQRVLA